MKPSSTLLLSSFLFFSVLSLNTKALGFTEIKRSSPEETYQTFYQSMSGYSSYIKSDELLAQTKLDDALETFEFDPAQVNFNKEKLEQKAIYLKEVLDRILENPRKPNFENFKVVGTNLIFSKQSDSSFLISNFSLRRAEKDFEEVKSLPYQKNIKNPGASHRASWTNQILPEWSSEKHFGLTKSQWVFLSAGLILSFVLYYAVVLLLALMDNLVFAGFYNALFKALVRPMALISSTAFLKIVGTQAALLGTPKSVWSGATGMLFNIGIFWVLYGLVTPFDRSLQKITSKTESDLDDQLVPLIVKTSRIAIVILAVLTIVQELGVNIFSLLAGLGVGGLAIALAAKDTAANFFGSLMILFDQPFKKGDWIKIQNMEGTVEDIGFRSTRIRTFYDSQIVIPNSTVASSEIDNLGRRKFRRTVETLGLTYSTSIENLELFIKEIKLILKEHPNSKDEKSYVSFKRFGDSALEVLLYFFLDVANYEEELRVKQEIYTAIKSMSEKIGVDFAFPSQSIYIEQGPPNENSI